MVWNPVKFADRIDAAVCPLNWSVRYHCAFQKRLGMRTAMGKPETICCPQPSLGHFLKGYIQRKALDFFEIKFAKPKGEPAERSVSAVAPAFNDAKARSGVVRKHGIAVESATGHRCQFAETVAAKRSGAVGGASQRQRHLSALASHRASPDILVCRLVDGKLPTCIGGSGRRSCGWRAG